MTKMSKRARENAKLVPPEPLEPAQAIAAVKKFKGPKFDQSVAFGLLAHVGSEGSGRLKCWRPGKP